MASQPIGYEWLVRELGITALPHWRATYLTDRSWRRSYSADGRQIVEYPRQYFAVRAPAPLSHLEFAVKQEGINLGILKATFDSLSPTELAAFCNEKPYSATRRRIWFLYEFFRGTRLDIPDLRLGNYISLLAETLYYAPRGHHSRRHRVRANLLGDQRFCPIVRRTAALDRWVSMQLDEEARRLVNQYDPATLHRAVAYLYAKETRSSYAIERESPSADKVERFVHALRAIDRDAALTKKKLIEVQNTIVSDARFEDRDYRDIQNYVGETNLRYQEVVHFVAPKPQDVPELMDGLLHAMTIGLQAPALHPVVLAAIVSFGFVLIHPFNDGNGRLHRYLIHHVLARRDFTPPGIIVPVSAPILADLRAYDDCLESFSKPLLEKVRFELDNDARMTVLGDTADLYRYIDFTQMAEYLFACVEKAIRDDFAAELKFLAGFDAAKRAVEARVDLPDPLVNLFIRVCAQNGWKLSKTKRESHFSMLTDDEIATLESAIRHAFGIEGPAER
jgi:hypothetical protein